ncbi:MAG: AmmeMemoRadiSam system protein B [bacterium]
MKNSIYLCFIFLLLISSTSSSQAKDESGQKDKKKVRLPVVAGQFYPEEKGKLERMIQRFLKEGKGNPVSGRVRGLIAPHAGYIYSGPIAATGYQKIDPATKTVIVLAPSHYIGADSASIMDVDCYRTPLGDIPLSPIAATLRKQRLFSPLLVMDQKEHSLEVQLPFLQVMLKNFDLVPITIGQADPLPIARALLPFIDEHTLVVASSDLSHYYPYKEAQILDKSCVEAITAMDFGKVAECEACGKIPILVLLEIARQKGWQGKLIDCRNSGDTEGPSDRVVGYASIAFVSESGSGGEESKAEAKAGDNENEVKKAADKDMAFALDKDAGASHSESVTEADQKMLLGLARTKIANTLMDEENDPLPENLSSYVKEKRGCFVTLHKNGQLRGCIGTIIPEERLCDCVQKNAFNAAFRDPRFSPLSKKELDQIKIEISILTLPRQLHFSNVEDLKRKLRPQIDGVILSQGWHRATYLPQVWEQLPDKDDFLESLSQKAGMHKDAWKDPKTTVEVYQAIVFSE